MRGRRRDIPLQVSVASVPLKPLARPRRRGVQVIVGTAVWENDDALELFDDHWRATARGPGRA